MDSKPANIYKLFGVNKLAEKLKSEKNNKKLEQLDRILTKYILSKAVDDLSDQDLEKLEKEKIKDGQKLYHFLDQHLVNFSDQLNQYGRDFKQEFARRGITR